MSNETYAPEVFTVEIPKYLTAFGDCDWQYVESISWSASIEGKNASKLVQAKLQFLEQAKVISPCFYYHMYPSKNANVSIPLISGQIDIEGLKQAAEAETMRTEILLANQALLNQALAGTGLELKFDGNFLTHETPRYGEDGNPIDYINASGKIDRTSPEHRAASKILKALNAVGAIGPFSDNSDLADADTCDRLTVFSINPEKLKVELAVNPAQSVLPFGRLDQGRQAVAQLSVS